MNLHIYIAPDSPYCEMLRWYQLFQKWLSHINVYT